MKETERLLIKALKKKEEENQQNVRDVANRLLRQEEATLRLKSEMLGSCTRACKAYCSS